MMPPMLAARPLQSYQVLTPRGPVYLQAENLRPHILMIHGFMRHPGMLEAWRRLIPGVGFINLPGHGGAGDLDEVSVQAWIEGLDAIIDVLEGPPPLLVGESLGAIAALGMRARAVIAVDPILSTHQLWPQFALFKKMRAKGQPVRSAFEALFETPFHWILERIRVPTLVLAGDVPLMPQRSGVRLPSLLTDEDLALYAVHPLVEAVRIPGGHNLLDKNPLGVLEAAGPFVARHGGFTAVRF